MPLVTCPSCGAADALVGVDGGSATRVECRACGHRWERDLTPTCRRCGSTDLEGVATSTLEEAGRGAQRTPSGIRIAYRCWGCGARDATSSNPLPPGPERPEWRPRGLPRREAERDEREDHDAPAPRGERVESAFGSFEVGGTVGGRWRLEALLRWSSTGSVWAATDPAGRRRVTFKLLHRAVAGDATLAAQHVGSARAVAGVHHPNLLRVIDVQRRGDDVLLVAEGVHGDTLGTAAPLTTPALMQVGTAVADALAAMHASGLSHLDVRPDKVLMPATGPVRLVDLGSGRVRARVPSDRLADGRMTWQAPEQLVGNRHGAPADVYGLGLTLWVAAGGRLSDLGVNPAAQARHRLEADLPDLPAGVAPELRRVVTEATRRRPAERPSAAELAERLRD